MEILLVEKTNIFKLFILSLYNINNIIVETLLVEKQIHLKIIYNHYLIWIILQQKYC